MSLAKGIKIVKALLKKIYMYLVHSHPEVDFFCKCLLNTERESLVQRPVLLALRILKINLLCHLPFLKYRYAGQLGHAYLSRRLVRPPVYDLAQQILEYPQVVTDLFGSALMMLKCWSDLYAQLEKELGLLGFARLRGALDDPALPLDEIYRQIGEMLGKEVSYAAELALAEALFVPNKYVVRLLDILQYNCVKVTAVVPTSYPRELMEHLLQKHGIPVDELLLTCEERQPFMQAARRFLAGNTAVFSADFRFIRQGMRQGIRTFYYHDPRLLLRSVKMPRLTPAFSDVFCGLCGLHLFGSEEMPTAAYELAFLCAAPLVCTGGALPDHMPADMCRAIEDFRAALGNYTANHDPMFTIGLDDAERLYGAGRKRIETMIGGSR